jgi:hypothetical protein
MFELKKSSPLAICTKQHTDGTNVCSIIKLPTRFKAHVFFGASTRFGLKPTSSGRGPVFDLHTRQKIRNPFSLALHLHTNNLPRQ